MAKASEEIVKLSSTNSRTIQGKGIQTHIHHEVVAKIAGLAVREVAGIHSLVPFGAGQTISKLANKISGSKMRDLGVHVEVGTTECAVDVRVVANYGTSIPTMADSVFKNVSKRITEMTGLKVIEINIEVMDLYFPQDAIEATPERERPRVN